MALDSRHHPPSCCRKERLTSPDRARLRDAVHHLRTVTVSLGAHSQGTLPVAEDEVQPLQWVSGRSADFRLANLAGELSSLNSNPVARARARLVL